MPYSATMRLMLSFCLTLFCTNTVSAATFHVATYGDNTATCGVPSVPCQTISFAIDMAVANDTILVHPGQYVERVLVDKDGVQLLSTKGRYATAIRNPSDTGPLGDATIRVSASRVRVGRRQQGFTLKNSLGSGGRIRVGSFDNSRILENVTIEGNYLGTDGRASLDISGKILAQGRRHQIRYNRVVGGPESPGSGGPSFDCTSCSDAVVARNTVRYGGDIPFDLSLTPSGAGESSLIQRNVVVGGNGVFRAQLRQDSSFSNNVYAVRRSDQFGRGFDIRAEGDVTVTGNIQAEADSFSVSDSAGNPFEGSGSRIYRDNLTLTARTGFYLCLAQGATVRNNTSVSSTLVGMQVESCTNDLPNQFLLSRNSTWDTQSEIGILNFSGTRVEHNEHFFGGGDRAASDFMGTGIIRGTTVARPNSTNVSAASKL